MTASSSVETRVTTLSNGMRVATDPMPGVETTSLGVWVEVGTRHEPVELNGISHLLEHMAFKGTARRSAFDIAAEIEDVGGHLNAFTSREHTAYYAKVLKDDLGLALDIVADLVQNAALDADELARERDVILQEISQAKDQPEDVIFDAFQELAYPDQALGRSVLGRAEVVAGFDQKTVRDFLHRAYAGPRMILAAAGNLDHDRLVGLAEEAFANLPDKADVEEEPARYRGGDWRQEHRLEQVQTLLGFDGLAYDDPDFFAASVYSTILGGGMSSRLFQEVREKRGLAYSIYSFLSCYTDGGLFGIHLGTGENQVGDALAVVCDCLMEIENNITETEVARARAQLKASMLMSLESTASRTEQIANQLMVYGRILGVEEVIREIEAVSLDSVSQAARRLRKTAPTLATLGPVSHVPAYDSLLARLG